MKENKNKQGVYLHIPFCEQICYYCDFNKVFLKGQPVEEYLYYLLEEAKLLKKQYPYESVETFYIGGGTPTSLSAKQLDFLLTGMHQIFDIDPQKEFTIEANPGDLTEEKMEVFQTHRVNRISLGVQTFDDELLKKIGRNHSSKEVYRTVRLLKKHKFENISIDLMYALPKQSMSSFKDTLTQALKLELPHYSLYSLILENKTLFMNQVRQGRLTVPDDDVAADMFDLAKEMLEKSGIMQYEISNFAALGYESKHNLLYWQNEHYYGIGAGASGYLGHKRYQNYGPIQHYLAPLKKGQLPVLKTEHLTTKNQMEEQMFLGLRTQKGVHLPTFEQKFSIPFSKVYGKVTEKLLLEKRLEKKGEYLRLTDKSRLLANDVFEAFLFDE